MTYTSSRCQHGWLNAADCETCKLLAEVTELRKSYIERAKEPVREWVGLDEAEMQEVIHDLRALDWLTALGKFEAKLKAKNSPEETA